LLAKIREEEPSPTRKKIRTFVASALRIPIRRQSPDEERRKALWLLGKLGPQAEQAIPVLVELFQKSKDPDLRGIILQVFASLGQRAHPALSLLITAANDPNESIRKEVALLLPRVAMNPEEIVPALEKLLLDPSWRVCESAAASLSSMDRFPKTAVPRLLPLFARQERSSQLAMLPVLYRADPDTTFQFFLERTHHQTPVVRATSLFILSQFKDRPAPVVSCLIEGLEDKEYLVRSAALYGLPPFSRDNPKTIAALMKAAIAAEGLEKAEILRTLEKVDPRSAESFRPVRRP
jgi:HEAT repeat protein